jgi:hypothetical protein
MWNPLGSVCAIGAGARYSSSLSLWQRASHSFSKGRQHSDRAPPKPGQPKMIP